MLEEVDKPGSEINIYVSKLEQALTSQLDQISRLQNKLLTFQVQLKDEQDLSKVCQDRQEKEIIHQRKMHRISDDIDGFDKDEEEDMPIANKFKVESHELNHHLPFNSDPFEFLE